MSAREKGANLSKEIIDRIVSQLVINRIETVNLGGNEPLFTNGINPKDTLLPYIIESLHRAGILVGLTTSGITLHHLVNNHKYAFLMLNDIDISFDSPYEEEHNNNRGASLFKQAISAMEICEQYDKDHTAIMCAMSWNFTEDRIIELVKIAKKLSGNVRINPIKPVEPQHMAISLDAEQYYKGFSLLMSLCDQLDLGEPPLAAVTGYEQARGCPCGRTSFRIHSITPNGTVPVSPCVYLHDYKIGNLLEDDLYDIVRSPQFQSFRRRTANPGHVDGCTGCSYLDTCHGGCAARSYLHHAHATNKRSLFIKDPYCPKDSVPTYIFPQNPLIPRDSRLVHMDYLCTWIGKPK